MLRNTAQNWLSRWLGGAIAPVRLQRHMWEPPYARVGLTTAAITALATVQVKNVSAIPA
jgi:hypothetical protein